MFGGNEWHMSQFRQAMLYVVTTPACGNTADRQWQTRKSVFTADLPVILTGYLYCQLLTGTHQAHMVVIGLKVDVGRAIAETDNPRYATIVRRGRGRPVKVNLSNRKNHIVNTRGVTGLLNQAI